jgi:hypothetical protein
VLTTREKTRIPVTRALIKVHKATLDALLVVANTAWVTTPIAIYLARALQVVIASYERIASSTDEIVDGLESTPITRETSVRSFDVEQLYPVD